MIKLRMATILPMLSIMERFNQGEDVLCDLEKLLDHEDYQVEFERYRNHEEATRFTRQEFIELFLNIRTTKKEAIGPRGLKYRRDDLLYIMDNVDHFRSVYKTLEHYQTSDVEKALEKTYYGLPKHIKLDDVQVIFIIGIGMSSGYIHHNNTVYDLFKVVDEKGPESLLNTIAHECHHMGFSEMMAYFSEEAFKNNMDSALLVYLSGEGTAIKFCNNFEGKLTTKLYVDEPMDVSKISYDYYMNNFDAIMKQFKEDITLLRNEDKTMAELEQLYMKHYFYTDVEIGGQLEENYLDQPVSYNFGADLWGMIHDVYGVEKVFEALTKPALTVSILNSAFKAIGKDNFVI